MTYYVNAQAEVSGDGSESNPFKTINEAAKKAQAGDTVSVAPGIYREHVSPVNAGTQDARITYISQTKLGAVITGAERITDWKPYKGTVYVTKIDNRIFGSYNPYTTLVSGDWFIATFTAHTGEVYLNGKALYEVTELEQVLSPKVNEASWDKDFTVYTWYTQQENDQTVIYANFQGADPVKENVEINVRENCFYPVQEGIGYITLSGFTVRQAATQWAPPTAYQEGMVGPHWSKGWIIEDCEISDSKCSGISLGKYLQKENDNKWLKQKYKDGTQTERECICQAQYEGWSKERIGSHTVRRCNIHDCGQTGIVGHLGGVFSVIEDNHIHHINNRQNLAGAEIGGIKMHAAIDVIIRRNTIHDCTRGLWLDWQAQGTRVTQNFFFNNTLPHDYLLDGAGRQGIGEDIFVEVSHGPTLIDNNIMLSDCALRLCTQGFALVHNLIAGSLVAVGQGVNNGAKTLASPRYTPYHVQHRTEVAGFMTILHGDARFYNNIFVQQKIRPGMAQFSKDMANNEWADLNVETGTHPYDLYPTEEEWKSLFEGYCGMGSPMSDRYYEKLPVWTGGNCYLNGAKHCAKEKDFYEDTVHEVTLCVRMEQDKPTLETNLYGFLPELKTQTISTQTLGMAFEPEEQFENPDGTPITFDRDFFGSSRTSQPLPGPFAKKI